MHNGRTFPYRPRASLGVFLGSVDSAASLEASSRVSGVMRAGFPWPAPYALSRGRPEPRPLILLRRPIGRVASRRRRRNVRLLCIGYAFRPRLSTRLTLGGLASPRKPWTCGGGVTLPTRATHASIRTPERSTEPVARPLRRVRDAPLPLRCAESAASVPCLAP